MSLLLWSIASIQILVVLVFVLFLSRLSADFFLEAFKGPRGAVLSLDLWVRKHRIRLTNLPKLMLLARRGIRMICLRQPIIRLLDIRISCLLTNLQDLKVILFGVKLHRPAIEPKAIRPGASNVILGHPLQYSPQHNFNIDLRVISLPNILEHFFCLFDDTSRMVCPSYVWLDASMFCENGCWYWSICGYSIDNAIISSKVTTLAAFAYFLTPFQLLVTSRSCPSTARY